MEPKSSQIPLSITFHSGVARGPELSFLTLMPVSMSLSHPPRCSLASQSTAGALHPVPSYPPPGGGPRAAEMELPGRSGIFPCDSVEARQLRPHQSRTARWQLRRAHGGDGPDGGFPQPGLGMNEGLPTAVLPTSGSSCRLQVLWVHWEKTLEPLDWRQGGHRRWDRSGR